MVGLGLSLLQVERGAQFCHPAGEMFELFKMEQLAGCWHRQVWPADGEPSRGASFQGFAGLGFWSPVLHALGLAQ